MKSEGTLHSQNNLEKEKVGRLTLPDFETHPKATVTRWQWPNDRFCTCPRSVLESPKRSPCMCGQMIFHMSARTVQWGKAGLFSKWCGQNWTSTSKECGCLSLTPRTKTNSKTKVEDLYVSPQTVKLLTRNFLTLDLVTLWTGHQKQKQQQQQ